MRPSYGKCYFGGFSSQAWSGGKELVSLYGNVQGPPKRELPELKKTCTIQLNLYKCNFLFVWNLDFENAIVLPSLFPSTSDALFHRHSQTNVLKRSCWCKTQPTSLNALQDEHGQHVPPVFPPKKTSPAMIMLTKANDLVSYKCRDHLIQVLQWLLSRISCSISMVWFRFQGDILATGESRRG